MAEKKKTKRPRMVYNRATGRHEPNTASEDFKKGFDVIKDMMHMVTRGGLKTDKRTRKHTGRNRMTKPRK